MYICNSEFCGFSIFFWWTLLDILVIIFRYICDLELSCCVGSSWRREQTKWHSFETVWRLRLGWWWPNWNGGMDRQEVGAFVASIVGRTSRAYPDMRCLRFREYVSVSVCMWLRVPLLVKGECVEQLKMRQKEKSMLNSVVFLKVRQRNRYVKIPILFTVWTNVPA